MSKDGLDGQKRVEEVGWVFKKNVPGKSGYIQ